MFFFLFKLLSIQHYQRKIVNGLFFFFCMYVIHIYVFFFIITKNTSKEYKSLYCVRNPLHKLHFTRYFAREYNIRLVLLK